MTMVCEGCTAMTSADQHFAAHSFQRITATHDASMYSIFAGATSYDEHTGVIQFVA